MWMLPLVVLRCSQQSSCLTCIVVVDAVSGNTAKHPVLMIIFTDTVVVCNIHLYFPSDLLIGDANLAKLRGDILQLFFSDIKNLVELC